MYVLNNICFYIKIWEILVFKIIFNEGILLSDKICIINWIFLVKRKKNVCVINY